MNKKQLQKFCNNLPGTNERLLPDPYNILVYSIDKTNFAYFKTSEPEKWRFSIKVSPDRFVELTGVAGVKPARYRGRYHWVTIVEVQHFPAAYLRELVTWSHAHALAGLSAARRQALLAIRDSPQKPTRQSPAMARHFSGFRQIIRAGA